MNKTPFATLLSALSLVLLFAVSCGTPARHFGAGSGGKSATGGMSTTGAGEGGTGADGTMSSAGTGAVSIAGGHAGGSSGEGGSGPSAGGAGMPGCSAQQKLCGGVCVDINDPTYGCDPTLCTTTGCPSSTGGVLVCDAGQCLLGSCGAGTKKCDGRCVSLTDPAYGCGATTCDASMCPNQGTGATLSCEGSACVIGTCPTNYKKCGNKCVGISDPTYGCGATTCDATSCPAPGTGTLVCQNSACVIGTCGSGTKKCGSNCVTTDANNGCADSTRCTACANNEACSGTPSTCQCVPTPMATACAGKCDSVSNGCGGMYSCGGCTAPNTCAGAGTANVCGCSKKPLATACSGKACGPAPDGCGGTYPSCGTCSSSSLPVCVVNTCKQCSSVNDCPSGTFNCTNNACVCRTPSSANLIKDGGFDTQSALNSWTSSQTVWTSSDADSCPQSGSITVNGTISRCIQIPTVPSGGTIYGLGMRYKAGPGSGGCIGSFNQDANCMQGVGPDFLNLGAGESATWSVTSTANTVYEGTSSIWIQCQNSSSFLTIDQIYLRVSGFTGQGF